MAGISGEEPQSKRAGVVHAVTEQLELERVAKRSARMVKALEWTKHRLTHVQSPSELQRIVTESERLMASESHEWWVLLSFQDVHLHV